MAAATAKTVAALRGLGYDVVIDSVAALNAASLDEELSGAGARITTDRHPACAADVVVKVQAPSSDEVSLLRPGAFGIALMGSA